MAAPIANTNATKWTETRTIKYLEMIEEIAVSERTLTLGSALTSVRLYQHIWHYWKKRWADHEEIMDRIYFIEQLYINQLVEGGLTRRMHTGQCQFILRRNYGYDKTAAEQEMTEEVPVLLEKKQAAPVKTETAPQQKPQSVAATSAALPTVNSITEPLKNNAPVHTVQQQEFAPVRQQELKAAA